MVDLIGMYNVQMAKNIIMFILVGKYVMEDKNE